MMVFDVDPKMSRSQQFPMISTNDDGDYAAAELESSKCVRSNNLQLSYVPISCSSSSSLSISHFPFVKSTFLSRMSSLSFVIFLDLARSVTSSQSLMLDI